MKKRRLSASKVNQERRARYAAARRSRAYDRWYVLASAFRSAPFGQFANLEYPPPSQEWPHEMIARNLERIKTVIILYADYVQSGGPNVKPRTLEDFPDHVRQQIEQRTRSGGDNDNE